MRPTHYRALGLLALSVARVAAWEFPSSLFQIPFLSTPEDVESQQPEPPAATQNEQIFESLVPPRIAIIGSGASGSSAAFWIAKARERRGLNVGIDIYEENGFVGGRTLSVHPYDNESYPVQELGAASFVKAAHLNLQRAADEFGFRLRDAVDPDSGVGIWDGEQMRFEVTPRFSLDFSNIISDMWRFGNAHDTANAVIDDATGKLLSLYSPFSARWSTVEELVELLNFTAHLSRDTTHYLQERQVEDAYIEEVIEPKTRSLYGQDTTEVHALAGIVAMLCPHSRVVGGISQIWEKFIEASNATLKLNTKVTKLRYKRYRNTPWRVQTSTGAEASYAAVLIAAPFHSTGISLPGALESQMPRQPYIRLHVALVVTKSERVNDKMFGRIGGAQGSFPEVVYTTNGAARDGGEASQITVISYLQQLPEEEWVVRVVSREEIPDETLKNVFNGHVSWVHRKTWDTAYPLLTPGQAVGPIRLEKGLYFVNSLEPMLPSMEAATVASRNIVDLVLQEQFNVSWCTSHPDSPLGRDSLLGWDY